MRRNYYAAACIINVILLSKKFIKIVRRKQKLIIRYKLTCRFINTFICTFDLTKIV